MTEEQQEDTLRRLFKRLNEKLFDNQLPYLPIWIIDKIDWVESGKEAWAVYSSEKQRYYFSNAIAEDIKDISKEKQRNVLAAIMIHEMAHQYCFENHINDDDHNENWQAVADEHGLERAYEDRYGSGRLSLLGLLAVRTFRF